MSLLSPLGVRHMNYNSFYSSFICSLILTYMFTYYKIHIDRSYCIILLFHDMNMPLRYYMLMNDLYMCKFYFNILSVILATKIQIRYPYSTTYCHNAFKYCIHLLVSMHDIKIY